MSLPDVQCERVDFDSFENQFRIVLRDTQTGISILMTASVPALISLAHACCSLVSIVVADNSNGAADRSVGHAHQSPWR